MMAKIEIDTKVLIKVGFYVVWGAVLWGSWFIAINRVASEVEWGSMEESLIKGAFRAGFVIAFGIQVLFSILKWLIFEWHQAKGVQE